MSPAIMLIRALYSIVYTIGFVLLSPYYLVKMWKRGKYRENFLQRFGCYKQPLQQRLADKTVTRCWIQAVSVGEINIALLLIPALQERIGPLQVVLTTTTTTAHALAATRLPAGVELMYFPQDFLFSVRRAYDLIQPDLIILMESELWPNHIWTAARRGVPLFLLNARMSPRSARRYHRMRALSRHVLQHLVLVGAQSAENARNFARAGMPADRVHMTGNMKYDASLPQAGQRPFDPVRVLRDLGVPPGQPVLVGGSTHPGEEEILFDICRRLREKYPSLFLVLVPRHVERTAEIVALARQYGIRLALRVPADSSTDVPAPPDCLLVNTTGELRWFYEIATAIFVGKSLVGTGGQNIIEAAASGHPVLFGPHMGNFKEITAQFVSAGAGLQVPDAAGLYAELDRLLADPDRCRQVADAARSVINANIGATQRNVELIAAALEEA